MSDCIKFIFTCLTFSINKKDTSEDNYIIFGEFFYFLTWGNQNLAFWVFKKPPLSNKNIACLGKQISTVAWRELPEWSKPWLDTPRTHALPLPGVTCIVETFEYLRQTCHLNSYSFHVNFSGFSSVSFQSENVLSFCVIYYYLNGLVILLGMLARGTVSDLKYFQFTSNRFLFNYVTWFCYYCSNRQVIFYEALH